MLYSNFKYINCIY